MSWQQRVNGTLGRVTGYELRRVAGRKSSGGSGPDTRQRKGQARGAADRAPDRLLTAPIFIFCSIRSGSTLLRVLLDTHSRLHAPHELHLRGLKVDESTKYVEKSMRGVGLDKKELEHLLWDRVLHRELQKSNKQFLINKTPGNAFMWRRIATCWPDARFIFLLRHPASVALSWNEARPSWTLEEAAADALRYLNAVEEARSELHGLTVRYEDLTADPEGLCKRICSFLGVAWEPAMLRYGEQDHGKFRAGLGDWTQKIRTGEIQPARQLPEREEIPAILHELCVSWGYLEASTPV